MFLGINRFFINFVVTLKYNKNFEVKFLTVLCVNNYGFSKLTVGMKLRKYNIGHFICNSTYIFTYIVTLVLR